MLADLSSPEVVTARPRNTVRVHNRSNSTLAPMHSHFSPLVNEPTREDREKGSAAPSLSDSDSVEQSEPWTQSGSLNRRPQ
jgi:hypothetical protein